MEVKRLYGQGTGADIIIPIPKAASTDFAVAADWTPVVADVQVSKDGAAAADIGSIPVFITGIGWKFVFTDAELQAKKININIVDAATKVIKDQHILITTYGHVSAAEQPDFEDGVHADSSSGISGANYPNGKRTKPVNDIDDAVTIAGNNKVHKIIVKNSSAMSFSAGATDMSFEGYGQALNNGVLPNSQNIEKCEFINLFINGIFTGNNNQFKGCVISSGAGDSGNSSIYDNCRFRAQHDAYTGQVFRFSSFEASASLNLANVSTSTTELFGCEAKDLNVTNLVSAGVVNIVGFNGQITIASSCTTGAINIVGGSVVVVDNSGVGCTVTVSSGGDATEAKQDTIIANLATVDANLDTVKDTDLPAVKVDTAAILVDTDTTIPAQITALNDLSAAQVNAEVDTALTDIGLDHLISASVTGTDIADDSIIAQLVDDTIGTADWDNYNRLSDALKGIAQAAQAAESNAGQADIASQDALTRIGSPAPIGGSGNTLADMLLYMAHDGIGSPSTYSRTTDSLRAIRKQGDIAWITGAAGGDATLANQTTILANQALIEADTQDIQTQIGTAGAGLTDLGGMSTGMKAEVNTEADAALADINLDHLMKVAVLDADVTNNSVIAQLADSGSPADWSNYGPSFSQRALSTGQTEIKDILGSPRLADMSADIEDNWINVGSVIVKLGSPSTLGGGSNIAANLQDIAGAGFVTGDDSLEAIRDRGDAAWVTGVAGGDATLANQTTILANLATVDANLDTVKDTDLPAVKVDTAAIKAKTDNLPASPANEVTLTAIGVDTSLLRKLSTNKKEFEKIGSDWFLKVYEDGSETVEVLTCKVEKYGGGAIDDLTGTGTPSIRFENVL